MARPREFEPHEALGAIMAVFWEEGYEGASMHDLESATGLNKQSLYRAFGDKRAMYLAALRAYEEEFVAETEKMLSGPGAAVAKIKKVFLEAVGAAGRGDRRGCFLCNASLDQAQLDETTREFVSGAIARMGAAFEKALASDARVRLDAAARKQKAAALLAAYCGLRVLVRADAPPAMLKRVAAGAIAMI